MQTVLDRFITKFKKSESGCWLWTAYLDECGYGRFSYQRRWLAAHRVSYELYVGRIPKGLEIDHKCRVRNCVNPEHLEIVTRSENCLRGAVHGTFGKKNKRKTHCPNGHEYTEENTYFAPNGWRQCKTCRVKYMKKYFKEHKETWGA